MARYKTKAEKRQVRRYRIRKKVSGRAERPRISVYRSLNRIYAQLIDDVAGVTLACADDKLPEVAAKLGAGKGKVGRAKAVGMVLAERAHVAERAQRQARVAHELRIGAASQRVLQRRPECQVLRIELVDVDCAVCGTANRQPLRAAA